MMSARVGTTGKRYKDLPKFVRETLLKNKGNRMTTTQVFEVVRVRPGMEGVTRTTVHNNLCAMAEKEDLCSARVGGRLLYWIPRRPRGAVGIDHWRLVREGLVGKMDDFLRAHPLWTLDLEPVALPAEVQASPFLAHLARDASTKELHQLWDVKFKDSLDQMNSVRAKLEAGVRTRWRESAGLSSPLEGILWRLPRFVAAYLLGDRLENYVFLMERTSQEVDWLREITGSDPARLLDRAGGRFTSWKEFMEEPGRIKRLLAEAPHLRPDPNELDARFAAGMLLTVSACWYLRRTPSSLQPTAEWVEESIAALEPIVVALMEEFRSGAGRHLVEAVEASEGAVGRIGGPLMQEVRRLLTVSAAHLNCSWT